MKKVLIVGLMIIAIAFIGAQLWQREDQRRAAPPATGVSSQNSPTQPETRMADHTHETMARVPAHYDAAPPINSLRGTLAPEMFTGNVRLAYQAAKEIPQTLAQLPCYCHCDMSQGHKSLHSCFEDQHAEDCGICIGEALMAYNLQRQGLTASQIRQQIIRAYGEKK